MLILYMLNFWKNGGGSTFVSLINSISSREPANGFLFHLLFPRDANERDP